jgi:hypothetical protein
MIDGGTSIDKAQEIGSSPVLSGKREQAKKTTK